MSISLTGMAALAPLFPYAIEKFDLMTWCLFWGVLLVLVGLAFKIVEYFAKFQSFDHEERKKMRDMFELQADGVEAKGGEDSEEIASGDFSD